MRWRRVLVITIIAVVVAVIAGYAIFAYTVSGPV